MAKTAPRILIYLLRRDVRFADNPIFYEASKSSDFTHLLPLYVLPANQLEISGFLSSADAQSPYPEARGQVSGYWRCGPPRTKFLGESLLDLRKTLRERQSGLVIRAGMISDVIRDALQFYAEKGEDNMERGTVAAVWMTEDQGTEERREERSVEKIAGEYNADFKSWKDEKYFVDHRDLPFESMKELPDVYTTFRKSLEPLRERPRNTVPTAEKILPLPPSIFPQAEPFIDPDQATDLVDLMLKPLREKPDVKDAPNWPSGTLSAHPFLGGETNGLKRIYYLLHSGAMTSYKDTRDGLLGEDFSTKLSAYLTIGTITARQIHHAMLSFEDGKPPELPFVEPDSTIDWQSVREYGKGESKGTAGVRFELLWRDYMRLCAHKFTSNLFTVQGFRGSKLSQAHEQNNAPEGTNPQTKRNWHYIDKPAPGSDPGRTKHNLERFIRGETGIGLIDASQRELLLTGYTSNRARQNVASFLASHMNIDWRLGAEWYESMLVDYDVGSNWGNWQYVAGVGNDPRLGRVFNPVKQALDYDAKGDYIKAWVEELRDVDIAMEDGKSDQTDSEKLMGVFQAWRLKDAEKVRLGLKGREWVDYPMTRIQFSVNGKGRGGNRGGGRGRGRGGYRGGGWSARVDGRGRGGGRGPGQRRMGNVDKAPGGDEDTGGVHLQ